MITGKRLKIVRSAAGLSQTELSRLSGVPVNAIAEFELGKREVRSGTIEKLCNAMNVDVRYVIDGTEISGP